MDDDDDDDDDDENDKDALDRTDENITNFREKRFRDFASMEYNGEIYMVVWFYKFLIKNKYYFRHQSIFSNQLLHNDLDVRRKSYF